MAAFAVLLIHYGAYKVTPSAFVAVDFFFILSGFVLSHSYGARRDLSVGAYMGRRLTRLYPMHIAGAAIALPWLIMQFAASPLGLWSGATVIVAHLFLCALVRGAPCRVLERSTSRSFL